MVANPLVAVSISKNAASGTSFLSSGIRVAPVVATTSEVPVDVGNRLLWANTATDTDFISEPLPGGTGVEDSWMLGSQNSPEDNSLVFTLPPGASLQMSTTGLGGAEVLIEGRPLLLIPPASAQGADGRSVPVTFSVSGDTLTTHVDLSGSVDFPVKVDPTIIGWFGEANGDNAWQRWHNESNCGGCFGFLEYPNLIQTGAEVGWPEGDWGEWYIGVPNSDLARVWRVDVTGLTHQPENQASLNIGIWGSNGYEVYSENGFAGATGPAPLVTNRGYSEQSMALCAQGAGGHDGGEQPLCDECKTYSAGECTEGFGGLGFDFADDLLAQRNEFNYVRIHSATIRYVQTAPPSESTAESEVYARWMGPGESPFFKSRGEDKGVGVSAVGIDAARGIREAYTRGQNGGKEMPLPGTSPAPGTEYYYPQCTQDPWCAEWAWKSNTISGLSTGVWTLAGWARNAVGLNAEQTIPAYVDKTSPAVETPSWNGITLTRGGANILEFSAKDGSSNEPQSGTEWMQIYIDGKKEQEYKTECRAPGEEVNIIPAANCFGMTRIWTLQTEDYAPGTHTITIRAGDWVRNTSERSFHITIPHPVGESQQVGPGTLNLRSGDYTLSGTDVSLPSGVATLSVTRVYSSQAHEPAGPLGPGWLLSLPDTTSGGQWQSLQVLPEGQVEVTTTGGQKSMFLPNGNGGYTSPQNLATYTLTEPSKSPVVYKITNPGGNYTQFTESSGLFMPTTVGQAAGSGPNGLNKVTYLLEKGRTHEVVGPESKGINCSAASPQEWKKERRTEEEHRGCRVLSLAYASISTARGENESEWGNTEGQLSEVTFTAWNVTENKLVTIAVARYEYDSQKRLRAEWDPRIEPSLKTVYGYDAENHVVSLTPPGQESWAFLYGKTAGDSSTGRLLKVTQAPASTKLWNGKVPASKEAPQLSGSAYVGTTVGVSDGKWSNNPFAYTFQWKDCTSHTVEEGGKQKTIWSCTAIPGATNQNYKLQASDRGYSIAAEITAINGGGSTTASTEIGEQVTTSPEYSLYTYSSDFGEKGSESGQFNHPGDVAIDSHGNLWVTDTDNSRVEEYNEEGQYIMSFGAEGSSPGQLDKPDALAIDSAGHVWVLDTENDRVEEFSKKGEYLRAFGSSGSGVGQFEGPEGIAVAGNGNIWVSDTYNHRIEIFSKTGKYEKTIAENEGEPEGIAIAGGHAWVADWKENRIQEYNESGTLIRQFGSDGTGTYGVAVNSHSEVLVAEAGSDHVDLFSEEGKYLSQFGLAGEGNGEFELNYPIGLATNSTGKLWITDSGNNRIEKWQTEIQVEGESYTPQAGYTIEYNVPVAGTGCSVSNGSERNC